MLDGELMREGLAISTGTPYLITRDRNTLKRLTWRGSKPGLPRLCFDFNCRYVELWGLDFYFPLHRESGTRYSNWRALKPNDHWAESFNILSGTSIMKSCFDGETLWSFVDSSKASSCFPVPFFVFFLFRVYLSTCLPFNNSFPVIFQYFIVCHVWRWWFLVHPNARIIVSWVLTSDQCAAKLFKRSQIFIFKVRAWKINDKILPELKRLCVCNERHVSGDTWP